MKIIFHTSMRELQYEEVIALVREKVTAALNESPRPPRCVIAHGAFASWVDNVPGQVMQSILNVEGLSEQALAEHVHAKAIGIAKFLRNL